MASHKVWSGYSLIHQSKEDSQPTLFLFRTSGILTVKLAQLYSNYNVYVAPNLDLVITFDWRVLLTQGQHI